MHQGENTTTRRGLPYGGSHWGGCGCGDREQRLLHHRRGLRARGRTRHRSGRHSGIGDFVEIDRLRGEDGGQRGRQRIEAERGGGGLKEVRHRHCYACAPSPITHTSQGICHTSYITGHTSHRITGHTSYVTGHTPRHTSQGTRHTSYNTCHTSQVTPHNAT